MSILCLLVNLYVIAILGRIILSWFPAARSSVVGSLTEFLHAITEPVLGPVRRVLPPIGVFDLSPLIVLLGLQIIARAALGCTGVL